MIANTRDAWPTFSTVACFGLAGATAGATITAIACKEDKDANAMAALTYMQRPVRADEAERSNIRVNG